MHHCSPEDLALAALGEELTHTDAAHLAGCASCTAEVTSLRRAVDVLGGPDAATVPLPPRVWDAIAGDTGVTSRPRAPAAHTTATPTATAPASVPVPRSGATPAGPAGPATPTFAEVVALPSRPAARTRRRQRWAVGGAVAASLLVGFGVGVVGVPGGGDADPGEQALAAVDLDPLDGWDAAGAATLLDRGGDLELQVELPAPPAGDAFYEVWLLGEDSGALALGVLEGGSGRYLLPAGVDLADYGTVDVSLEHFDGNPAHSTDSVARGSLG